MQPKVFISYSHEDGFFVDKLTDKLREWNISEWVDSDSLRTGQDWRFEIDKAIEAAFTVLVVHSSASKLSEYVIYEWSYALAHKVEVVVLRLKDIELHARLSIYHQPLDFFNRDRTLVHWDKLQKCLEYNLQNYQEKPNQEVAQTFVDHILRLLKDYDPEIRRSAAQALGYFNNSSAIPALYKTSQDNSADLRRASIEALANIGDFTDNQTVTTIIAGLYDPDYGVRLAALKATTRMGEVAIPELIEILQSKDNSVYVDGLAVGRLNASIILRDHKNQAVIDTFLSVLNDPDPNVRGMAATALGGMKNPELIPYLEPLLEDENEFWWHGAKRKLSEAVYADLYYMGEVEATQALLRHLSKGKHETKDEKEE